VILSYKYRICPNRMQSIALGAMLADFCWLYNAGLEQRITAYRRRGVSLSYSMQAAELKAVRALCDGLDRWSFSAEQQVLRRLDKTFRAFFSRGDGFPRFRATARYHAAEYRVGDGLTLRKSGRIGIIGVPGEIKVRWHRQLASNPTSAVLTRQCGKWYVVFHVEEAVQERSSLDSIGVDFGLTSLVALSNGETVARPNWTKRATRELRRRQRAVARCKRGSNARRKRASAMAKFHSRIAAMRHDFCHKMTRDMANRFGRIAIEDLSTIWKGLARGMHAKHVHDAAWAQIAGMLRYKAAKAGGECIAVDPRGTSQTCPECGTVAAKTLTTRMHRCECGCSLDRDVAAAMVVHFRAFGFWPGTGLETLSERVAA
jgi:putative transposase